MTAPLQRSPLIAGRIIRLVIPGWAPSKSNSYRIARGRLIKGSPGRAGTAVQDFELATLTTMCMARVEPFEGPVSVEAMVFPPNMRSDIPGVEKLLLDAMQNWRWGKVRGARKRIVNVGGYGCYLNDAQVRRFLVDFGGVDKVSPRIVVRIFDWYPR